MPTLDMVATLDPGNGVARSVQILPPALPQQPLWTVAVDIGGLEASAVRGLSGTDFPLHLVGACSRSRLDALVRGCGEAVERFSLLNSGESDAVIGTAADIGPTALRFFDERVRLGDPAASGKEFAWYDGRRLIGDEVVRVPAPLVDYPATDLDAATFFDPSPSGAASGCGYEHALRAALLEIVERDAVMAAWGAQLALPRVDPDQAVHGLSGAREFAGLLAAARALDLDPVLARIPTALPGVETVVCGVTDTSSGEALTAVGCRISASLADGLAGALREALQVRCVLLGVRDQYRGRSLPAVVASDLDRARFWADPAGAKAFAEWSARFPLVDVTPNEVPDDENATDLETLLRALAGDGADPIAVDLTARLPARLREMGWAAVKVIAPGYQPLIMDERHNVRWRVDRFAALAGRLDESARRLDGAYRLPAPRLPAQPHGVPHPLI